MCAVGLQKHMNCPDFAKENSKTILAGAAYVEHCSRSHVSPLSLKSPNQTELNKQQQMETRGIGIIIQSPNPLCERAGEPTGTPFTQGLQESLAEHTAEL